MLVVGIDPDLHDLPIAVIDIKEGEARPTIGLEMVKVPRLLRGADALLVMAQRMSEVAYSLNFERVPDLLVVEGQRIYPKTRGKKGGKAPNPNAILRLGQVAGLCLCLNARERKIPEPREWKGQVPKLIHQGRVLTKLGWLSLFEKAGGRDPYYTLKGKEPPPGFVGELPNKGDWKHAIDAIGLALWGLDQHRKEVAFESRKR